MTVVEDLADPVPGTPGYMARVLLEIEDRVHRVGWNPEVNHGGWGNDPPALIAICGRGEVAAGWREEALLTEPQNWPTHSRLVLAAFAAFLAGESPPGSCVPDAIREQARETRDFILDGLAGPTMPMRALALVLESHELTGTQVDRERHPGSLADHPDAKQARSLLALSTEGTVWYVSRASGQQPGGFWHHPTTRETYFFGRQIFPEEPDRMVFQGPMARSLQTIINAVNARAGRPLLDLIRPAPGEDL